MATATAGDTIRIRISPAEKQALAEYCERHDINLSAFVRTAIRLRLRDLLAETPKGE